MSFQVDHDPDVRVWTLEGNDVTLMVQRHTRTQPRTLLKLVTDAVVETFGGAERSETSLTLLGKTVKGHRLSLFLADTELWQDYFAIECDDATIVLMVQNTLDENGAPSDEGARVRELLSKTFTIKP